MAILRKSPVVTTQTAEFDITEYGATGNGSLDTDAIQGALDDCAGSGGTVYVPPGTYLTAPLRVGDDTTLRLEANATIEFVGDYEEFPTVESRWEGWDQVGFHPCLWVREAENVEITGRGTIDGGGSYWWQYRGEDAEEFPEGLQARLDEFSEQNEYEDDVSSFTARPPLLQIYESENVSVSGVTLQNSPFWNTHVVYSEDVTIHDARIRNPWDAPNGDGIDIDSSQFVRVSDTYINAGDDAICLKSGKDEQGREVGVPCQNITVANCTIEAGHGGVVIGSEMSGDVRHVAVTNCTFIGTDRGIRIKTQRGRGGVVEDMRFDNIIMRRVACPFVINGYYFMDIDSEPEPVDETTPMVRNVHYHHITARDVESAAFLAGLPEQRFDNITFEDVRIDATRPLDATDLDPAMAENYDQRHGMFCKSLGGVSFTDVHVHVEESPALTVEETDSLTLDGLDVTGSESEPTVRVKNVGETRVSRCSPPESGTFLSASGEGSDRVSFAGNYGDLADRVDLEGSEASDER